MSAVNIYLRREGRSFSAIEDSVMSFEVKEIYKGDILNITCFDKGFVFAVRKESADGVVRVKFYGYDGLNDKFSSVKKDVYLKIKFGFGYEEIVEKLGDYVSCDSAVLKDGRVIAVYPGGEYYFFNQDGSLSVSSLLTYRGTSAVGAEPDGDCIWCAVPDRNAIIQYRPGDAGIPFRIGGGKSTTFDRPCSVTVSGEKIYVCNSGSRAIREYELKTNKIKDFMKFDEKVFKFIVKGRRKFVWLKSGLYELV